MSTQLAFGRDLQGYNAFAPKFPTNIFTATLAANTAQTVAAPLDAPVYIMYVRVQPTGYCWVSRSGTAAVPAGGTLAAAISELIAGTIVYKRLVYPLDVISFITPNTTCDISVSFYAVAYP